MSEYLQANEFFELPPEKTMDFISKVANWYFKTEYLGVENLAKNKPGLYVSNHTLLGLTDGPLYMPMLMKEKDIFLRPLVDKMQKDLPLWRSIVTDIGGVDGSKENCEKLMQLKQHILVFPGGTNEILKIKGEQYKLKWQERYGFVKLAIENEYPIIPISSLGGDDIYDIILDKKEIMDSKLGTWLKDTGIADKYLRGGSIIPPILKGVGPTLIPKPRPLFYAFGKPIDTKKYNKDASVKNMKEVRKIAEDAIYDGIKELTKLRDKNPEEKSAWRKFLNDL